MTRKRLWMNRISGIVCLLLWIALVIFLSGTTGKIVLMQKANICSHNVNSRSGHIWRQSEGMEVECGAG
mgnify:CR=1 FL=1